MSYSVNFSEDPKTPGKIVLDNVVMNGAKYAPSAVTEVFTKDATGLLSKQPIDLTNIQYALAGAAVVAPVTPGGVATEAPDVVSTVATEAPDVVSTVATEGGVEPKVEQVDDSKVVSKVATEGETEVEPKVVSKLATELGITGSKPPSPVTTAGPADTVADNESPLPTPALKGGATRKTKRNRRKNKRFVKKSYKRRR
jgi:hypothetical protein